MQLIVFSKLFRDKSISGLIELAHAHGFEGFDLCVRPGYPVEPDNAPQRLPEVTRLMRAEGLAIPMVTGNFDLLTPDHPTALPLLEAMDRADVRLLKLGYFRFDPATMDYWAEVERIRVAFAGWEALGRRYGVRICYHTHSQRMMGLNCASLMHLIQGFDPQAVGAYVDPGHMAVEGEEFSVGVAMVRRYLSIVSLKDVLMTRAESGGHGAKAIRWVPAGEGVVDWSAVFGELARIGFSGPLTIHCEFEVPAAAFDETFTREVRFFRHMRDAARIAWPLALSEERP